MLNHFLCCSMLSFLVAFMIACFFFSSSATRFSVGTVLVAISLLVLWCIRTYWDNKFELPSGAALWNKCEVMLSCSGKPDNMSQEPKETLDALTSHGNASAGNERQNGTRQLGWPLTIFVRHNTSHRVDGNLGESTEV